MVETAAKKVLTLEDIEAQTALALPERETPQTVTVTCLAVCIGTIEFRDLNVGVAATVCATVQAIAVLTGAAITCRVSPGPIGSTG